MNLAKKLVYGRRGEPITYGRHRLRYLAGTRPIRLKYRNSKDGTDRNDVAQIEFVLEHMRPGERVLDIGANVGQYAVLFGAIVGPAGRVVSFEPDLGSRRLLERNLVLNQLGGTVEIDPRAVFDYTGHHLFFSNGADANAALIGGAQGGGKSVPIVSLDDYLREAPAPDWVKIDTEGAEINILLAARTLLRSPAKILCELHPYAWEKFGVKFEALEALLVAHGRAMVYLDGEGRTPGAPSYGTVYLAPPA